MLRCNQVWSVLLAVLVSSSAWALDVNVEFDESVDFSKFKSFAMRGGKLNARAPVLNSELTKKRIQSEIEKALIAKGLVLAEKADLNVSFDFGANRTMDTRAYPAGWRGRGTRVVKVPQSDGTLVIDLHDGAANSLVWRAIANDAEDKPAKLADKLDDMVKKSIAKYPPKRRK